MRILGMSSSLHGYDEMIKRLVFITFYQITRVVFGIIQTFYWSLNGTLGQLHQSKQPQNYNKGVHVMNIVWFYVFDKIKNITRSDYILTHNRFENPDYIFKSDNVTLLTISKNEAIFVEVSSEIEVWRSKHGSFIAVPQRTYGLRLLIVPMHHFLRMSEDLGDPKQKIICLFNSARCGSTMFTQIMEMTGCCVTLSEPKPLVGFIQWYREDGDTKEVREAFRGCIRWLCRPFSYINPNATVIKFACFCHSLIHLVLEVYPNSKVLFMYREVEKSSQSFYRLSQEAPLLKIAVNFSKYHGYFAELLFNLIGCYGPEYNYKSIDDIDICLFMWAVWVRDYVEKRKKGFSVAAVRYEDLIKTPRFAVGEILKYCELPEEALDKALRGLEQDSQRNSGISQEILGRHKAPELTARAERRAAELFKSFDLPPVIKTPILLDGTITCK